MFSLRFVKASLALLSLFSLYAFSHTGSAQPKDPESTLTPAETRAAWQALASRFPKRCRAWDAGPTDCGQQLQAVALGASLEPQNLDERRKPVFFILNAIHPGEPCGVDASLRWATLLLERKDPLLDQITLLIVPFYNIDGGLVRGCCSRASQIGPTEVGFRGNARNLDLNRDFVKADALNTQTFQRLFQRWDPDLFADTHTTNGADYVYPMTLIATQPDKLGGPLADWMRRDMLPALYGAMNASDAPMCPYVNTMGPSPESGLVDFLETPRFSTGYAALFQTVGFVTEAHMLKPFSERVRVTEKLLDLIARQGAQRADTLLALRRRAREDVRQQQVFPLRWRLDTTRWQTIDFRGYERRQKPSAVSGLPRYYYDKGSPWTKPVRYYDRYVVADSVERPMAYIIPQAWREVIERLRLSGVRLRYFDADVGCEVECQYITNYTSPREPYEGHYLHDSIRTRTVRQVMGFRRGDCIVELGTHRDRFIIETLEPRGPDSYFAWNFFDGVLMQKEGFSDYLFEDTAEELLAKNPALKSALDSARTANPALAASAFQQLMFVYYRSPYYETSHRRLPVYRLVAPVAYPYYEDLRLEER